MRRVMLKHAAASCALLIVMASIMALALGSPRDALATGIGGALASLDFMAIIWIVSGLLSPETTSKSKAGLGMVLLLKLLFVGSLLYSAIVRFEMTGIGIPFGIASAIAGFTWGMLRATSSREGQRAIAAEEQRLAAEDNTDA